MAKFKLRLSAPSASNKYYKHTSGGGVNECIKINGTSCIPNCVGYCWGAFYEMFGSRPKLSRRDAKQWYGYEADGYRRSQTPALGAVACWNGGEYGHVAIVVGVHSDHITVAQSNYGGIRWEMVNCYKMDNGGYKSHAGNTGFQGFILPPDGWTYGDDEPKKEEAKKKSESNTTGIVEPKYQNKALANGKQYTTNVNLNLRRSPDTGADNVICVIPKNAKLMYYGRYDYDKKTGYPLVLVAYGSREGYVMPYNKATKTFYVKGYEL